MATSTLFTAIFAGISIVWDREFGFLREMLVAPIPRSSILVGKCFGGATIATLQALILVALAGLVGVPYDPVMIIALLALLFLTALAMTAFGLMISARIKKFQAVMPIVQLVLTPMMFLSGSLFPLAGLPVVAGGADQDQPADLRGGADAARRLRTPRRAAGGARTSSTPASPGAAGWCRSGWTCWSSRCSAR